MIKHHSVKRASKQDNKKTKYKVIKTKDNKLEENNKKSEPIDIKEFSPNAKCDYREQLLRKSPECYDLHAELNNARKTDHS